MTTRIAVIVFPGTNCELDTVTALENLGATADLVWHKDTSLGGYDAAVLPGGFAHGDYLRPGAIARFSPIMDAIRELAETGAPVVGICNGFQVLTEAHLLPGALQKNAGLRFICRSVDLTVARSGSVLTRGTTENQKLRIPINHFEGNYTCDSATLEKIERNGQVVLRYLSNPNGSLNDIAGICNKRGNVAGIMPHPERASDRALGSDDGNVLLASLIEASTS